MSGASCFATGLLFLLISRCSSQSSLNEEYSSPNTEVRLTPSHARSRSDIIKLFQNAVDDARKKTDDISSKIESGIPLGLTINFKGKSLHTIPDSVVDILKNDVDHIFLNHNQIDSLPIRFSDCAHITYLNLRANRFKYFPKAICELQELQVLDMGRNELLALPEEFQKMKRLRFLQVDQNQLEDLPYSLGFLDGLRMLKLEGNPFKEPLKTIISSTKATHSPNATAGENEQVARITERIKQYLKLEATTVEASAESSGESPLDTPKPIKRQSTLRFPVVPTSSNGESLLDQRSPGFVKPPIPQRSHFRITSGQSSLLPKPGMRRPGVAPLIIGSDRSRSNSESVIQATETARQRRMRIVPANKLDPLEEASSNRNSLHLRGTSHASALRDKHQRSYKSAVGSGSSNSISPSDEQTRDVFQHRLASVPERRGQGGPVIPSIEAAKSFVFALHLIHPTIHAFACMIHDGSREHSNLEQLYYNAFSYAVRLDQELCLYNDSERLSSKRKKKILGNIDRTCGACTTAYGQFLQTLAHSMPKLLQTADERHVRAFKMLLYGCVAELKIAIAKLSRTITPRLPANRERPLLPIMGQPPRLMIQAANAPLREQQTTPTRDRTHQFSAPPTRLRSDTMNSVRSQSQSSKGTTVATRSVRPANLDGRSRSNSRSNATLHSAISSTVNTPKTGESFLMPATPALPGFDGNGYSDYNQEAAFEKVYSGFSKAVQNGRRILPQVTMQLSVGLEASMNSGNRKLTDTWQRCIQRARQCLEKCNALGNRLSTVKLNDPALRRSREFWCFITRYIDSWSQFIDILKIAKQLNTIEMARLKVHSLLKPLHDANKAAARAMELSPWAHYSLDADQEQQQPTTAISISTDWRGPLNKQLTAPLNGHQHGGHGDSGGSSSSPYMPTTPLSAALGPAAQATIPTSASSTTSSFDRSFRGNVFERAETLLSSQQTSHSRR